MSLFIASKVENLNGKQESDLKTFSEKLMIQISSSDDAGPLTPRTKYAMGLLGLIPSDIQNKAIEHFSMGKTKEENQMHYDFYHQQRSNFICELFAEREKIIADGICDESAAEAEEIQHIEQLLIKEDEKLEKLFRRQDRETRRLLADQLESMEHEQKQLAQIEDQIAKQKRIKAQQVQKQFEKQKRKQEIVERRQKIHDATKAKEVKKYFEMIKKQEENEIRFSNEQLKKYEYRQQLLNKRLEEQRTNCKNIQSKNRELDKSQSKKMQEIVDRYSSEIGRYEKHIQQKSYKVRDQRNKRCERHSKIYQEYKKQLNAEREKLIEKQVADEKRLQEFQKQKELETLAKKKKRLQKMAKTISAAKGGEEERLKKVKEDTLRAEKNRLAFLKEKEKTDSFRRFIAHRKNDAAMKAILRKQRAVEFKNEKLLEKTRREDERLIKDLHLREQLRQQRIVNDTQVKMRQQQLKDEIMEAKKCGDIQRLKKIIAQLEVESKNGGAAQMQSKAATNINSPIFKKSGKAKMNILMPAKKLDSSIAQSNKVRFSEIKANIARKH